MRTLTHIALAAALLCGCRTAAPRADLASLREQVMNTERAFAKSMADRDHAAFTSFLAAEAIFFSGDSSVRGRSAVAAQWEPFFEGKEAPFSWEPDQVEVLDSGDLALSTGPVRDPAGNVVGRFNSIWRLESPGSWRIVFDKGSPVCKRAE
ncbi:MAG TPA: nuclear transport factor 2 family protein [Gemmatimonadaceae bacterium]|nr:nuclear transport factor 2 family protein [Gemmatimonadaceae bacterium]